MKKSATCTIHTCDGCSARYIQLDGNDMPNGFYVRVFEVHSLGASAGDIYVCGERCLLKAFKRREDIWNPKEDTQ